MSRSEATPAQSPGESLQPASERDSKPNLWVELGIDVGCSQGCPLGGRPRSIERATIQLLGTTCHIAVEDSETSADGMKTVSTGIDDGCLCRSLCEAGLTPVEMTVEGGSLVVSGYSTDREGLGEAISELEGKADRWRLRRLATASGERHQSRHGSAGQPEELNLTEKQREAVQLAVDEGYYDRPRDVSLGDLAERLDITRSALSQRLNAVESKLVTDLSRHL
ncbi:MAG: helix-turn-helix domain-containing protein [Halobacteriota archaeon]